MDKQKKITLKKDNVKHLEGADLTQHKIEDLGGTKGADAHLRKISKNKKHKDFYT